MEGAGSAAAAAVTIPPNRFAGVVPFAVDDTGQCVLLLAREAFGRDKGRWSGFAGRPEPGESASSPEATAAREASEESCGLLGTPAALERLLPAYGRRVDTPSGGVHFLLPFPYFPFAPYAFQGMRALLEAASGGGGGGAKVPCLEKDCVEWVPARDRCGGRPLRAGFARDLPLLLSEIETHQQRMRAAAGAPARGDGFQGSHGR